MSTPWSADRFEELFRVTAPRLRNYVARHAEHHVVDDVMSETYTIAWRKLSKVPADPLPWLIVTARNCLRHEWRSRQRSDDLWRTAVREHWRTPPPTTPEDRLLRREEALEAFDSLSPLAREALLLTAWDGLKPAEAARVAGCSTRAFTVQLSRARAAFDQAIHQTSTAIPPLPTVLYRPTVMSTQESS